MTEHLRRPRIGVLGQVGNQNLGDEAVIAAVVQHVRGRYPEAELRGFTVRPHDTEQRHRIRAFPVRRRNGRSDAAAPELAGAGTAGLSGPRARLQRIPLLRTLVRAARSVGRVVLAVPLELAFLARAYRHLRGTDLLVVAGSGQLNDFWGGPWGFPFTLLKWSVLAHATGARLAFLSVGAGPLQTRLGRFFIKHALRLADYRSYRDDDSRRCIVDLGVPGEHPVVPDLVFSLQVDDVSGEVSRSRPRTVGINPMPFFDDAYYPENDSRIYDHYIRTLASFADWLVARGYRVRFFATQLLVDHDVITQIRALMRQDVPAAGSPVVVTDRINSFDELVAAIDAMDVVVATRYHGTLFGLIRQKPVVSIAYQRKSMELMKQLGQGGYAIDARSLTLETLRERFLALESHQAEFADGVRRRLPDIRATLDAQYERTFGCFAAGA